MASTNVQTQPKFNRKWIFELARPKEPKTIWITTVGPRVQWGTQEMLWPVTREALSAGCTTRLASLAINKKNFLADENVNRSMESTIWKVSPRALQAQVTPRVIHLAEAKTVPDQYVEDRPNHVYSCGRPSPIWEVSRSARSGRVPISMERMAEPKSLPDNYSPNREVKTEIRRSALRAVASERMEKLACAKNKNNNQFREPIWPISDGARSAAPSNRCVELSHAKPVADGYLPAREVASVVTKAARKFTPTTRIEELSHPNVRASMDHVQFDPDAFRVKESALKSRASARTEELAQPIIR